MPRDHARINLDLWGDDDWMDLSVDSQMLYLTLYTNPGLSFCGAGEWHSGRIANRARDWTKDRVETAAAELSRRLFVIIDTDTDEYLLRSWIKHDGLWRTPNMAVTVANARGELSSKTLRGVVVFEVAKLKKAHPDSTAWDRPAVQKMLAQKAIDAADLEPYNPTSNGGPNPGPKGGANPYGENGVNPTAKGGPTPAPTPNSYSNSKSGYVSTEGHLDADGLPTPYCLNHPKGTNRPCAPCAHAREARDAVVAERKAAEKVRRSEIFEAVRNCPLCDDHGRIETEDGLTYCDAHLRLKDAG
ncbi:replication initiation protein [Mycobacterium phage Yoshi]|uniref:Helix-turn-helix DNA binding domain protein n=1 Tax=Mycobacterium phage Yoshi TaxID=2920891 RepID=G1BSJ5_9CAUD|nr:replication initiation protein [Mycobacterium phage Yoshi]AEK07837.1 hypothetical protein YOSHI_88 [Mycobacterium phage Yoshi]